MRFRERFYRFMQGRYGSDRLNRALSFWGLGLMLAALVLSLIRWDSAVWVILYLAVYGAALGCYIAAVCRFFSRNIPARLAENARHEKRRQKRLSRRRLLGSRWRERRTHVFRRCPGCRSVLRLPKKRGRHGVTCPRCARHFSVLIVGRAKVPKDNL